jgi:hypothetical protein
VSDVIFLADAQDSTTSTTYYGKHHQATIADEVFVRAMRNQGKCALVGTEVRAQRVSPIATTTATVNWVVDQACTAMSVDYGTTAAYGSNQAATPAAGVGAITAALTGLTTGTTYHYRINVTCAGAVTRTIDATFRTS